MFINCKHYYMFLLFWKVKSIEFESKRQTPYFFCKAVMADASSSAWWRKSNRSETTVGRKEHNIHNQWWEGEEKLTCKRSHQRNSTFLLCRWHEHDRHVEAPHPGEAAQHLQRHVRTFAPAQHWCLMYGDHTSAVKPARNLKTHFR